MAPLAQAKSFIEEFKAFISKGNVIDLAVAVVIGGAFGKIVTSLVSDIIMPLIGMIQGNESFADLRVTINGAVIKYGNFIQNIVDFLIIAASIFVALKILTKLKIQQEKAPAATPPDIVLLQEIRDLLKEKQ